VVESLAADAVEELVVDRRPLQRLDQLVLEPTELGEGDEHAVPRWLAAVGQLADGLRAEGQGPPRRQAEPRVIALQTASQVRRHHADLIDLRDRPAKAGAGGVHAASSSRTR